MRKKNWRKKLKRLASWNVNGIRACVNKGYVDWLTKESPDIVSLQETKAQPEQFPPEMMSQKYQIFSASAVKRGYSGTLVQTKISPQNVKTSIDIPKFDNEGRTVICEYDSFILINGYYPNGQRDLNRVPFKLEYSESILNYSLELMNNTIKPVILCGDFNTAHEAIDLANPKSNTKTTGFLEIERAWLDKLESFGFVDVFRFLHPNEEGHYSWWTYRGDCRERNIGWRIDYFYLPKEFIHLVKDCYYQPQVMGSDHCPLILEIDI